MNFYLIDPKKLNPIEGHSKERVNWLSEKIISEGYWSNPIAIAKEHNLVMDGHHRLESSLILGLRRVPCFVFSYKEINIYSLRDGIKVSHEIIEKNFLHSIIFPYKTVKHELPNTKFKPISLKELN